MRTLKLIPQASGSWITPDGKFRVLRSTTKNRWLRWFAYPVVNGETATQEVAGAIGFGKIKERLGMWIDDTAKGVVKPLSAYGATPEHLLTIGRKG